MRLFNCSRCGNLLYFDNVVCNRCEAVLGFLPDPMQLVALEPVDDGLWRAQESEPLFRMCTNYRDHKVCNWMLRADSDEEFCRACRLNGTIPDLSVPGNCDLWRTMETEKRALIYSALRLGLPVVPRQRDPDGLEFAFMADSESSFRDRGRVMTGHAHGLITINLAEADPVERERMRNQMDEPYRTILGHFRHESGHYYWERLVRDTHWLGPCRELFGDDRIDYGQALQRHYRSGPPDNWSDRYVSAYATTHPWEDWAESWAHYLHIVDTLETAYQFGLSTRPRAANDDTHSSDHDFNAYREDSFDTIIESWLPLVYLINSLNRSIGHEHAYPFVLAQGTIEKLRFVHGVVREATAEA